MDNHDLESVRSLWRTATTCGDGFTDAGWVVIGADGHRAAPSGWVGVVEVLGSVVVAAPIEQVSRLTSGLRRASSVADLTDPDAACELFGPFRQMLGPAVLFYGRPSSATDVPIDVVGPVPTHHSRVVSLVRSATQDERDESSLDETTSGVYLALDAHGHPTAGCGWQRWPYDIAHMCVLAAPTHRGRGFGGAAAARAIQAAADAGLLAQWRAAEANRASIALADRLGLHRVGRQFSVLLE